MFYVYAAISGFLFGWLALVRFWPMVAYVVSRPAVAQWLFRRAAKTPYWNLEGYMNRWWLFNPIRTDSGEVKVAKYRWCPISIRIHHILRADEARDPHNHPGSFRTIILKGWYVEERDEDYYFRGEGETAVLRHGEFHHVHEVSEGGVWTLFIMWDWRATWGFRVDGRVVPHQEYHNGGMP